MKSYPNTLTSNTSCQLSIPSQEVPLLPIPALFMSTATCMQSKLTSRIKWG